MIPAPGPIFIFLFDFSFGWGGRTNNFSRIKTPAFGFLLWKQKRKKNKEKTENERKRNGGERKLEKKFLFLFFLLILLLLIITRIECFSLARVDKITGEISPQPILVACLKELEKKKEKKKKCSSQVSIQMKIRLSDESFAFCVDFLDKIIIRTEAGLWKSSRRFYLRQNYPVHLTNWGNDGSWKTKRPSAIKNCASDTFNFDRKQKKQIQLNTDKTFVGSTKKKIK